MFKFSPRNTLCVLLALVTISICCAAEAMAQTARCRRSIQVDYIFPATLNNAAKLTALAFTNHFEPLPVQVQQTAIDKMDRDERGSRVAHLDVDQRTYKVYLLFLDDHGILEGIRAISGLQVEEINGVYTIPFEKSYEVSLPRVYVDKTNITVGEILTATIVCEDGHLKLYARSGNEDILTPCQRPLSEVFTENEFCYQGAKPGQNVIQVVMHNGGDEIFCTNSELVNVK